MMRLLRRSPLVAALLVAAAALAAILLAELAILGGDPPPVRARPGAAADAKLLPPVPQVAAEQAYSETAARPLFIATRRPAPDVQATPAVVFQRGQFTLQGVIVAGNARTAMLREKSNGRIHRLGVGGEVNGIKVVQIDPAGVTLGMGEEREVVPLVVQRPGATPGVPGQVAAAAAAQQAAQQAGHQGPFAPPPSAFPVPGGIPPGTPLQPGGAAPAPGAGSPFARPAQPTVAPPATAPAPGGAPAANPQGAAAPMTAEELLARRRARRAQQNQ